MVEFSRWVSLAGGILIGSTSGSGYSFGIFSQDLSNTLNYSLAQVQMVASMGAVGTYAGVFAGFFYVRLGPKWTVFVGSILSFIGFYMLYMYLALRWESSFFSVCTANFISQLGTAFLTTVAVSNSVLIFPSSERGRVVGLTKGVFALSTSVFAQYHISMFNHDVNSYLLFMSLYVPALSLILIPFVSKLPIERAEKFEPIELQNNVSLTPWLILTIWLCIYLGGIALIEFFLEPNENIELIMTAGMCIIMLCYFLLPKYVHNYVTLIHDPSEVPFQSSSNDRNIHENYVKQLDESNEYDDNDEMRNVAVRVVEKHLDVQREINYSLPQMLKTTRFWLLAFTFFCTAGSGLVIINNISQITESFGWKHKVNDLYILLFGICNFLGRIGLGILSDRYSALCPRTLLVILCAVTMAISHLVLAIFSKYLFFFAVVGVSLSYGGLFSMVASLIADLFGVQNHGINYGMADVSVIVASFMLPTFMVSWTSYSGNDVCKGNDCFQTAFFLCAFLGIFATISAYILHRKVMRETGYQNVSATLIE